ncbi:hypothetical protein GCM10023194_07450 [Planotetraspora phitsanulokensis]|uniref:EfeO-type cupredoxin-like domain-containing protein n=1 Tax=Planotetraspora phitsanulokensis TaxID=575192 RepID=A0A8J3U9E2_9ACTN|nr:hypothetical protein [Planotetraspora phitsanulokensis]GII39241.1 hypothetical protein Pph01_42440 [Planotetraspora phitsanulokensis]
MTPAPARLRSLLSGLVLGAALLGGVSACSGSSADTAPASATVGVKEINVTIAAKSVTPPPGRIDVTKGQTVRITVTSDVADEAHVHGYDKGASLQPGTPATIEFVADQDGLFEVETHESGLQLFQLAVR